LPLWPTIEYHVEFKLNDLFRECCKSKLCHEPNTLPFTEVAFKDI
jgi:hypothetical protein